MTRSETLSTAAAHPQYDLIVIGGGSSGVGTALDATLRGYSVLLLEAKDFGSGTSSRSTKLIHGGVRYLEQGDVGLVRHALHERQWLLTNASEMVKPLSFVLPLYGMLGRFYYGAGLMLYDRLAGREARGLASKYLSRQESLRRLPNLKGHGLRGGWLYHDAQFDDARLLIELAKAAVQAGGHLLNYVRVERLLTDQSGKVHGAAWCDTETGNTYESQATTVINAAGPQADRIRAMAGSDESIAIAPSQGAHIVVDRSFLTSRNALLVPKTPDGRVLFVIPWHGSTLIGTTDTALSGAPDEPVPLSQEIDFILETAASYLQQPPTRKDIRSTWAGIRPLVRESGKSTAATSRDHTILADPSGLLTLTGGKWTTFRLMAEDCVNRIEDVNGWRRRPCLTRELRFTGSVPESPDVAFHVREEMARTVEDVLARRTRVLFLDAQSAIDQAPHVARQLAAELHRDEAWIARQTADFRQLAVKYLP